MKTFVLFGFSLLFLAAANAQSRFETARTRWAFQTNGPVRGTALVSGDDILFGSADGYLYSVRKDSGKLNWKFDSGAAIAGAPAVAEETVVVSGRGRIVYGIDAESGVEKWRFRVGGLVPAATAWDFFTAAPVVEGKRVFVGSGDGWLYALEVATGRLIWKWETRDRIRAACLVKGGVVYLASGDDHVYALDAEEGTLIWDFETAGATIERGSGFIRSDIFTQPSLVDGALVFASRDSHVYAVDAKTGAEKWRFSFNGSTWAMSTVADEKKVYVGWSTNNKVCALDLATGEKLWERTVGAHTYTRGLLLGEEVVWGCADGNVYGIDRETGEENWSYSVGTEVYSPVVYDQGRLIFGADDGRVRVVEPSDGELRKAFYLPEGVPDYAQGFIVGAGLAGYLEERGFDRLESEAALEAFLRQGEGDRSVVVFVYAQVPRGTLADEGGDGGLLRAYLESGGKVVWPSGTSFLSCFDGEGNFTGTESENAERLLGLDFILLEDSGSYFADATQEGMNWGLPEWLTLTWASLETEDGVVPLAVDEYGRVAAWVRHFGGKPGSGWVSFCPTGFNVPMKREEMALIEAVALYGLK